MERRSTTKPAPALAAATLAGSGATFPQAYYETVIAEFKAAQPAVTVTYGGGGSGKGQTDLQAGLVQWAGSDSTVKPEDMSKYKGPFLYFPTVAAPITVSYNLSSVKNLQLSAETLAKIFEGEITKWNDAGDRGRQPEGDAAVHGDHGRCTGPTAPGTTANFTAYLVKAARRPRGRSAPTRSSTGRPVSRRGPRNAGVAQIVKDTDGAIGYVDYSDAKAAGLVFAAIKNAGGKYVAPSIDSATAALAGATVNAEPHLRPAERLGRRRVPDHRADVHPHLHGADRCQRGGGPQGPHELHLRRRPGPGPHRGLRTAALRHPVEGEGPGRQDRLLGPIPGWRGRREPGPRHPSTILSPHDRRHRAPPAEHRPPPGPDVRPRLPGRGVRVGRAGARRSWRSSRCTMIVKAWPAFQSQGLSYFTGDVWDPQSQTFGTLAFAFGTVVVSAIAVVIAVPVSIGIALFTTEVAPRWLRTPITYVIDLLAAVPSVVYGLWGVLVLAPELPGFYTDVARRRRADPGAQHALLGRPDLGPLVHDRRPHPRDHDHADRDRRSRARRSRRCPQSLKDAAHALGATRWETIRAAVIPHSRSGLVAGDPDRPRPGTRRDHRRRAGHRLEPADHGQALLVG